MNQSTNIPTKRIAVIIPAYNEERTIKDVILDFWSYNKKNQYDYKIYVVDNNSTDKTNAISKQIFLENNIAGEVIFVQRQGKANAMRDAFLLIDAEVYIMIDGDSTYWAEDIDNFIQPILNHGIDMVIGNRISNGMYKQENKRFFHGIGNALVRSLVNVIFHAKLNDIMTGYRGFSKKFVKTYPIMYEGFELETDMTVFCLEHKFKMIEVPIKFTDRPTGSYSKLKTYQDGLRVIVTIFNLFRNYRPLQFFGLMGVMLLCAGLALGILPVVEYIKFHYVYRVPTAILSTGLIILSFLSFAISMILDSIRRYQNMNFELNLLHRK